MSAYSCEKKQIRPPIVDGIFYPNREDALKTRIKDIVHSVERPPGKAFAILSPHAALQYTGKLTAEAFTAASLREIKTVVIIGPMHRDPVDGFALPTAQCFQTPLGSVRVNNRYLNELVHTKNNFMFDNIPHFEEHCIEIQIPFIQYIFPQADIVPILIGKQTERNILLLSDALNLTFGTDYKYILFVVTSNTASFISGTRPAAEASRFLSLLKLRDWHGMVDSLNNKNLSACNTAGIASILALCDIDHRLQFDVNILDSCNSGAKNGNSKKIVYYTAAALYLEEQASEV